MRKINIIWIVSIMLLAATAAYAGWSQPVRISQPGDCWDPQIIASGDTLHVVYENTGERYDKISYVRSTDGGQSWSTPIRLTERGGATYFPRIVKNGPNIMVLWKEVFYTGYDVFNIGYALSSNNGATWDSAQYIFNPNWQHILYFAAANYDSTVVLALSSQVAYDLVYFSLRSTNFGANWSDTNRVISCYQSGRPDMAQANSVIHFVWDGSFVADTTWEIYYKRSLDEGLNWLGNIVLSTPDEHGSQEPAISLNKANGIMVAWTDGKYSPYMLTGDVLMRASNDTGATWGNEIQATFNHYALKSDISVNGDTINVVWVDLTLGLGHGSIYHTCSIDEGVFWSDPVRLDNTDYESRDPAIAACCGKKFVVWEESLYPPDSMGLFFSSWSGGSDAIENGHDGMLPSEVSISAYPNPFNSDVTITYSNLKEGDIGIYDIQGKLIRTLKTDGGENGKIIWDARDALGKKVSSGEYFLKAGTNQNSPSIRLLYLK